MQQQNQQKKRKQNKNMQKQIIQRHKMQKKINEKKWWQSKTILINALAVIGGVVSIVQDQLVAGVPVTALGLVGIVLRVVSTQPIEKSLK